MNFLANKVAVVTGAARGIGAATAARLAADGAAVAVLDLNEGDVEGAVGELVKGGATAAGFPCDVSDSAAVEKTFEAIRTQLGPVGVLVNNAGVLRDNLLFKMSEDDWETVMGVHLRGSFLCAREAQKSMVDQRWGKIVNLSSSSALGARGQANYSAAKAGIQAFTKTLAIELGPFNINVNAVAPGFIETAMTRATAERIGVPFDEVKESSLHEIPMRRIGQPEDVAAVISFLCSDDASYVAGQTVYVTGGPAS
ncbi:3-oxoacyl-ACP reductase FabG [Kribbella speibonae]|uniref:3-oxoacyl-ACP reductase FabG n=1 Tax=Kribbella speibonae TaxID=1572660 RepID=UPI001EDE42CA|nr:3-oxoacyl-ACP reductase FabG [Kribbella speibonae]